MVILYPTAGTNRKLHIYSGEMCCNFTMSDTLFCQVNRLLHPWLYDRNKALLSKERALGCITCCMSPYGESYKTLFLARPRKTQSCCQG